MSKLLIVLSLAFAILALESHGATFAPFGIHLKRHHFDFQTHNRRFIHPRMRIIRGLKLIKNQPTTKYEKELQKSFKPKVENLQISQQSDEAKKLLDYLTIRKIWKPKLSSFSSKVCKSKNLIWNKIYKLSSSLRKNQITLMSLMNHTATKSRIVSKN